VISEVNYLTSGPAPRWRRQRMMMMDRPVTWVDFHISARLMFEFHSPVVYVRLCENAHKFAIILLTVTTLSRQMHLGSHDVHV